MTQMQHPITSDQPDWSILSETISYHSCPSKEFDISPGEVLDPPSSPDLTTHDPGDAPFFTPYEGVHCKLHDPSMYDDLSDVSTTYLGPIEHDQHKPFFKEATISLDLRCIGKATLPNEDRLNVLFDTGASCSYMSYEYYRENEYLRSLPKYQPRAPTILVGSGDKIPARFVIPLQFLVDHCFKVYTLVCTLGVSDFIFGIKNIMETEGRICTQTL